MKICRLLVVVFALLPLVAGASPNQVSGYVFQDLNKNGSNDSEPPLAGAAITMDGTGSTMSPASSVSPAKIAIKRQPSSRIGTKKLASIEDFPCRRGPS